MNKPTVTHLTAEDMRKFERLRVPLELLDGVIIRVTEAEAREYGINLNKSGILFQYYHPITGQRVGCRLRPDDPDVGENGRPKKYLWPYGDRRHLFILPSAAPLLADPSVPIVLVEAEKSVFAITAWAQRMSRKLLVVGLGGCWGWRGKTGKTESPNGVRVDEHGPLPDLDWCHGRKVFALLDANAATNRTVGEAQAALSRELRGRKAEVVVLNLPVEKGVNGPDDYLAVHDDGAMAAIFDNVVNGAVLLGELVTFIRRYVSLSDAQAVVAALWIVHTYAIDAADATPYLAITSAEKRCGKSRLLEVLNLLASRPWKTGRVTAACLMRKVEAQKPTLLLDESDAAFNGPDEYSEALRGMLNEGHLRGGMASLCVGQGTSQTFKDFEVFCPKAIAGIGKLPDTVADRSIPVRLQRKKPAERVERFRRRLAQPEAATLREKVAAWAKGNLSILREAWPELPEALNDRQQDGAEPLLAIADLVGGEWPTKARKALVEICGGMEAEDESNRVRLLADIRDIFGDADKLSSAVLVEQLSKIETSPWAEFNHGKPLTPAALGRLLRPFRITPRTIRMDGAVAKGYLKVDFEDAWCRYLPAPTPIPDFKPLQPLQRSVDAGLTRLSEPLHKGNVTDEKNEVSQVKMRVVTHVTDEKPGRGDGTQKAEEEAGEETWTVVRKK